MHSQRFNLAFISTPSEYLSRKHDLVMDFWDVRIRLSRCMVVQAVFGILQYHQPGRVQNSFSFDIPDERASTTSRSTPPPGARRKTFGANPKLCY
jgi:hypothetical protein